MQLICVIENPASSERIPFDTMVSHFRDLNARHISISGNIVGDHTRGGCARGARIPYVVEVLNDGRHCPSAMLPLGLDGLRLVSSYWSISGILMIYTCAIVAVAVLMKGPVLAMFVVGVFDLVSWCPGDAACILNSPLELTSQRR